ncbi:MAG: hypothetical protein KBT57_09330 [bacterium]|nr:hypothetical protein [Candidatus Limimorpha equi]
MNKRRKILATMLAAFMLLVPMVSTAQIKVDDEETSDLSGTWGTVQITDYQTEEYVPLGEGLWLLAGAAGLYLLVKSRKTRKATAVAAAALALTLGTTQCKKTEESVIPAGETISISFMAGNGAKSDIDVYTGRITWEKNDEVYVVYDGQLLSEIPLLATPDSQNRVNASISGTITTTVTIEGDNPSFTFYYVGKGVTFDKEEFTFGIQNQNGINAGHYMVGRTEPVEMKVKEGTENSYEPTQDGAKHFDPLTSVLRLNTSEFGANQSLTMDGGNNLMTGDATPSYTAGSITFTSGDDVQISVIPTTPAGDITLSFSGNGKVGSITVTNGIKAGRIYSKVINNAGYPIHVDANGSGVLQGKFSVSATKYVQFSRGNLKATRSSSSSDDWKLGFFANQYEYGTYSTGNVFTVNDTEMSLFTFGFDTKESSFNPIGQTSGSEDWGNEYNRQYSLPSGTWQTLTGGPGGEWWYLLDGRPNAANLKVFKTVHEHSNCLIILPDDFDLSYMPTSTELTDDQWSDLEAKGAVCLPQAGIRVTSTYGTSSNGYWANNSYGQSNAYGAFFSGSTVASQGGGCSNYGYSIRLVQKFFKPHEYVDLDLPNGTLWATCNVGADSPKEYGDYFQWGGVTPVTSTSINVGWATCPGNGGYGTYNESAFNTWKAENLTDDILEPTVDAACVNWGGDWRMPTSDDFKELCDNTYNQWIEENGVKGWKFTSKINSGKHIFLPAAGSRYDYQIYDKDTNGLYWSSSLNSSEPDKAYYLSFGSSTGIYSQLPAGRGGGCPVRPVRFVQN